MRTRHILGENQGSPRNLFRGVKNLRSSFRRTAVRLHYGARFSSQTALAYVSPKLGVR